MAGRAMALAKARIFPRLAFCGLRPNLGAPPPLPWLPALRRSRDWRGADGQFSRECGTHKRARSKIWFWPFNTSPQHSRVPMRYGVVEVQWRSSSVELIYVYVHMHVYMYTCIYVYTYIKLDVSVYMYYSYMESYTYKEQLGGSLSRYLTLVVNRRFIKP